MIQERKHLCTRGKDTLSFETWMHSNGKPLRDDDCDVFVSKIPTEEQCSLVCVGFASVAELTRKSLNWAQVLEKRMRCDMQTP